MQGKRYPPDTGPYANLSEEAKKKRLDVMVRIWQSDTERRIEREGYRAFIKAAGLDEYRYSVWLPFPEWGRSTVVGQVITLRRSQSGSPGDPSLFSAWRPDSLVKTMPELKRQLSDENGFN